MSTTRLDEDGSLSVIIESTGQLITKDGYYNRLECDQITPETAEQAFAQLSKDIPRLILGNISAATLATVKKILDILDQPGMLAPELFFHFNPLLLSLPLGRENDTGTPFINEFFKLLCDFIEGKCTVHKISFILPVGANIRAHFVTEQIEKDLARAINRTQTLQSFCITLVNTDSLTQRIVVSRVTSSDVRWHNEGKIPFYLKRNRKNVAELPHKLRPLLSRIEASVSDTEAYKQYFAKIKEIADQQSELATIRYYAVLVWRYYSAALKIARSQGGQALTSMEFLRALHKMDLLTDSLLMSTLHEVQLLGAEQRLPNKKYHRAILLGNCIKGLICPDNPNDYSWIKENLAPLQNALLYSKEGYEFNVTCLKLMVEMILDHAEKVKNICLVEKLIDAYLKINNPSYNYSDLPDVDYNKQLRANGKWLNPLTQRDIDAFVALYNRAIAIKLDILVQTKQTKIDLSGYGIRKPTIKKLAEAIKKSRITEHEEKKEVFVRDRTGFHRKEIEIYKIKYPITEISLENTSIRSESGEMLQQILAAEPALFTGISLNLRRSHYDNENLPTQLMTALANHPPYSIAITNMQDALQLIRGGERIEKLILAPRHTMGLRATPDAGEEYLDVAGLRDVLLALHTANVGIVEIQLNGLTKKALAVLAKTLDLIKANNPKLTKLYIYVFARINEEYGCLNYFSALNRIPEVKKFLQLAAEALQQNEYITELNDAASTVGDHFRVFLPDSNQQCELWLQRNRLIAEIYKTLHSKRLLSQYEINDVSEKLKNLEDEYSFTGAALHRSYQLAKMEYYIGNRDNREFNKAVAAFKRAVELTDPADPAKALIGMQQVIPYFIRLVGNLNVGDSSHDALLTIKDKIVGYLKNVVTKDNIMTGSIICFDYEFNYCDQRKQHVRKEVDWPCTYLELIDLFLNKSSRPGMFFAEERGKLRNIFGGIMEKKEHETSAVTTLRSLRAYANVVQPVMVEAVPAIEDLFNLFNNAVTAKQTSNAVKLFLQLLAINSTTQVNSAAVQNADGSLAQIITAFMQLMRMPGLNVKDLLRDNRANKAKLVNYLLQMTPEFKIVIDNQVLTDIDIYEECTSLGAAYELFADSDRVIDKANGGLNDKSNSLEKLRAKLHARYAGDENEIQQRITELIAELEGYLNKETVLDQKEIEAARQILAIIDRSYTRISSVPLALERKFYVAECQYYLSNPGFDKKNATRTLVNAIRLTDASMTNGLPPDLDNIDFGYNKIIPLFEALITKIQEGSEEYNALLEVREALFCYLKKYLPKQNEWENWQAYIIDFANPATPGGRFFAKPSLSQVAKWATLGTKYATELQELAASIAGKQSADTVVVQERQEVQQVQEPEKIAESSQQAIGFAAAEIMAQFNEAFMQGKSAEAIDLYIQLIEMPGPANNQADYYGNMVAAFMGLIDRLVEGSDSYKKLFKARKEIFGCVEKLVSFDQVTKKTRERINELSKQGTASERFFAKRPLVGVVFMEEDYIKKLGEMKLKLGELLLEAEEEKLHGEDLIFGL